MVALWWSGAVVLTMVGALFFLGQPGIHGGKFLCRQRRQLGAGLVLVGIAWF